jgi:hypothetical protein
LESQRLLEENRVLQAKIDKQRNEIARLTQMLEEKKELLADIKWIKEGF